MPIKSSGTLSFATDIVGEFEDTTPHSLSEFYRAGGIVPDAGINANVPTSNEIKFSDFYGATNVIEVSISNNSYIDPADGVTVVPLPMGTTLNLFNLASVFSTPNPVTGAMEVPFVFTIDYDSIFNNSIIVGGEFSDLTIDNYGVIAGRGGHGYPLSETAATKTHIGATANDNNGNAAILVDYDVALLEVVNRADGFIAGGGNGANRPNSAHTFTSKYGYNTTPNPSEWIDTYGDGYAGGGGGWNGGVGGYGAAATFAEAYETDDDGVKLSGGTSYGPTSASARTDRPYFGQQPPTLAAYYVTSRSASGLFQILEIFFWLRTFSIFNIVVLFDVPSLILNNFVRGLEVLFAHDGLQRNLKVSVILWANDNRNIKHGGNIFQNRLHIFHGLDLVTLGLLDLLKKLLQFSNLNIRVVTGVIHPVCKMLGELDINIILCQQLISKALKVINLIVADLLGHRLNLIKPNILSEIFE
jgi:hypothetical protein